MVRPRKSIEGCVMYSGSPIGARCYKALHERKQFVRALTTVNKAAGGKKTNGGNNC